jgi:hypothetical protein
MGNIVPFVRQSSHGGSAAQAHRGQPKAIVLPFQGVDKRDQLAAKLCELRPPERQTGCQVRCRQWLTQRRALVELCECCLRPEALISAAAPSLITDALHAVAVPPF